MAQQFDRELHALYFLKNLRSLPAPYASQDSQRVVLVRLRALFVCPTRQLIQSNVVIGRLTSACTDSRCSESSTASTSSKSSTGYTRCRFTRTPATGVRGL